LAALEGNSDLLQFAPRCLEISRRRASPSPDKPG
jgi:hypothetical protein